MSLILSDFQMFKCYNEILSETFFLICWGGNNPG